MAPPDSHPPLPGTAREKSAGQRVALQLLLTLFSVGAGMLMFETTKELTAPKLTKWQSHYITVTFSSLIASLVATFVLRRTNRMLDDLMAARAVAEEKERELSQTVARLETRELQFASMAANVPGMLFRLRVRRGGGADFLYVSEHSREILHLEPAVLASDAAPLLALLPADERARLLAGERAGRESLSPLHCEGRSTLPSGEARWFEVSARPGRSEAGELVWDGLLRDTTDRRFAEERLRLLESAVIHSHDAILIADAREAGAHLVYHNEAFRQQSGYERAEVLGSTLHILRGPESEDAVFQGVEAAMRAAIPMTAEVQVYRRDRTPYWIEMDVIPVLAEGRCTHFVIIQQEITKRRLHEAALQEAKESAEAASRSKSEFLSRMSHELRTPLNAILGFAQLSETTKLDEHQREHLHHIVKAGWHLLNLINEVLDISRIEAGRLGLSPEPVQLADLVRDAVTLIRPVAGEAQVHLAEGLAETAGSGWVLADHQRLKQVLLNLLSNAVKYNRPGGTVSISSGIGSSGLSRLCIADTGIGIAESDLPRLFSPFERMTNALAIEGTGLGLALSRRLVEAMGGTLTARSTLGRGSEFWVELPIAESPLEADVVVPLSLPSADFPEGARATVLYIEDNLANLQLIQHILARRPEIHLLTAMQSTLGMELARRHRPDLILLDLHLPDVDGLTTLRKLRAETATSNIPVIMISADATPGSIERLLAAGARHYLTKPIRVEEFVRTVDEVLDECLAASATG